MTVHHLDNIMGAPEVSVVSIRSSLIDLPFNRNKSKTTVQRSRNPCSGGNAKIKIKLKKREKSYRLVDKEARTISSGDSILSVTSLLQSSPGAGCVQAARAV